MASTTAAEPLAPADAAWLLDFARMCRAAARAVSLYPPEHPAIGTSLERLVRVCQAFPAEGIARMWVFPEGLRLNQRKLAQPDTAVAELAHMLHERRIGEVTIFPGVTADHWRLFLSVLGRTPDDLAEHGGFARVWTTSGGQLVELKEIDYSELLKERPAGQDASWDVVFQQFLQGGLQFDEAALQIVLDAAGDPARLAELIAAVQARVQDQLGPQSLGGALARMLDGAMKLAPHDPDTLTPVVQGMAQAVSQLPADTLVAILTADRQGEPGLSSDLRRAIVGNMPDAAIADFISRTVVEQGGASARLAEAFQVLVPDAERQRALLALARGSAASALGSDQGFEDLWEHVEDLLLSYSDKRYVSTEYGEELTRAQQRPTGLDAAVDPPERVAGWLGTVAEDEVRHLDHQLVVDLLSVEDDPARWCNLLPIVTDQATALAGAGRLEPAVQLVRIVLAEAKAEDDSPRRRGAATALERLARPEFVTGIAAQIHLVSDEAFGDIKQMFRGMGSPVIRLLAETLAREPRNPVRLRLRDLLLGFGAVGRHSVEQLKKSPDPEVRRTAVHLLREFGGQEALPDLASLLDDREPHVQREATRAILFIGTPDAYATLAEALRTGSETVRETIMTVLTASRDEAAVPLLCYIVREVGPGGRLSDVYRKALELLGDYGGESAVEALGQALYRGEWWAPFRTRTMRSTAARSLARLSTPEARAVLEDALARGVRGVRAAVRPFAGRRK